MEYLIRLRNFWFPDLNAFFWLLLAIPGLYFFQTVIHEGTHGLTAFMNSGTFPTVAPFPHLNKDGGFLNGVTLYEPGAAEKPVPKERDDCNSSKKVDNPRLAGWIGSPQLVALLLIVCLSLIFLFADIRNEMWRFVLRIWYFGLWLDFMWNTAVNLGGGCKPGQDWSRVMLRGDINTAGFAVLTWFLWSIVLSHFIWVYWSKWGRNPVDQTNFWAYRGVAAALAGLSLLAIVLSLTVANNNVRVDKGSAVFIIGLILQIASFIWYVIYFGLTFKYKDQT